MNDELEPKPINSGPMPRRKNPRIRKLEKMNRLVARIIQLESVKEKRTLTVDRDLSVALSENVMTDLAARIETLMNELTAMLEEL